MARNNRRTYALACSYVNAIPGGEYSYEIPSSDKEPEPEKRCSNCDGKLPPTKQPRTDWPLDGVVYCSRECKWSNSPSYVKGLVFVDENIRARCYLLGVAFDERVTREVVLRRDQCCMHCGSEEELAVDHWIPLSKGGGHVWTNVQILCRSCNSKKRASLPSVPRPDWMCQPVLVWSRVGENSLSRSRIVE